MHEEYKIPSTTTETKMIKNAFQIDNEIEQFGGLQKFVLLKSGEDYVLGSFANLSHSEILAKMDISGDYKILGGGLFKFNDNTITIDTSFLSSKLGPINMASADLQIVMQNLIGNKYKVELSE